MDQVIRILVYLLEAMFALGVIGSGVVLVLTSIEDIQTLLPGNNSKEMSKPSKARGRMELPPVLAHK